MNHGKQLNCCTFLKSLTNRLKKKTTKNKDCQYLYCRNICTNSKELSKDTRKCISSL